MIAPQIFEDTVCATWVPQEADAEMDFRVKEISFVVVVFRMNPVIDKGRRNTGGQGEPQTAVLIPQSL